MLETPPPGRLCLPEAEDLGSVPGSVLGSGAEQHSSVSVGFTERMGERQEERQKSRCKRSCALKERKGLRRDGRGWGWGSFQQVARRLPWGRDRIHP